MFAKSTYELSRKNIVKDLFLSTWCELVFLIYGIHCIPKLVAYNSWEYIIVNDSVMLDLGLLPSAVKGEDGLMAIYGLLKAFGNSGGHAFHINVFDADTLRDVQAHPENIRICKSVFAAGMCFGIT